ncbi:MAG: ATP-binding protein [Pseudobdellovibrionaceae bacterium]
MSKSGYHTTVKLLSREERILAFLIPVGVASLLLTVFSYFSETLAPYSHQLIDVDIVILTAIILVMGLRLFRFIRSQSKTGRTSRLNLKLAGIFALVSLIPAFFMAFFSLFFFYYGVQTWFSDQIRTAVEESQEVAKSYLAEHQNAIRADLQAMAKDIDLQSEQVSYNQASLERLLNTQIFVRNLSEAIIFDSQGKLLARSNLALTLEPEIIPEYALTDAALGDAVVFTGSEDDRVRAVVKLQRYPDAYLAVGRLVDQLVLSRVEATRSAAARYEALERQYGGLRITITLVYIALTVALTGTALWFGFTLARKLVRPIDRLLSASEQIRAGDLSSRVNENTGLEEFDILVRSFNRMTQQLSEQREGLVTANREMDERRKFTETVLTGVSSGVLSTDREGHILLANPAALRLLDYTHEELTSRPLQEIVPAFAPMLNEIRETSMSITSSDVSYMNRKGRRYDLTVKIAPEDSIKGHEGFIITFDDISALKSAQRKAAWSDVARRIAHEIKNPLTPIQLSAERIKRRFSDAIPEDEREVFEKCIQTIGKHVEDIGHMVAEFSAFARMPMPVLHQENFKTILNELIILQTEAHPHVTFIKHGDLKNNARIPLKCDAQQLRQVLTNLMQNAMDAMEEALEEERKAAPELHFWATGGENGPFKLVIADNGPGFPEGVDPETLTDPYVTHKAKGTGLGLAIVKKIMEDHGGNLHLGAEDWMKELPEWPAQCIGGVVALTFPGTEAGIKGSPSVAA